MNKIKFAVMGCGRIGVKHIDYIEKNPNAELIALIDERINEIEIKCNNKFKTLEEFFESKINTDIVNIATPNGLHAEHAIKVLESGVNVLIEKPMALKKKDAEMIIKTSINKNKKVFIVMQNRYSPNISYVKKLIEGKHLGNIFFININCFWNRNDNYFKNNSWHGTLSEDGGVLYTQFSHFIDTIYWLFGDIKNINTKLFKFNKKQKTEFEDSGTVRFETANGALCVINFSIASFKKYFDSSISIIAEKGNIKIGGQYLEDLEICEIDNSNLLYNDLRKIPVYYNDYDTNQVNHALVIQNAIDVLRNNSEIKTNALDGLKVTEIIENIYENGRNKK